MTTVDQPYAPHPEPTPAQREASSLRNLNTVLYVASFLLVAAAVAFVFTGTSPIVKLVTLLLVTAVFYGAGLLLHVYAHKLHPAAAAFTGTGLAIFPFTGFALSAYGGVSGSVSWLSISLIGLVLFAAATMVLRNAVIAYLTLAFVLSLTLSAVTVADTGFVWYFIGLIAVSAIAALVSSAFPRRIPPIFARPVNLTGQIVAPLTILASLVIPGTLGATSYELIFGAVTLNYLAQWLVRRTYANEAAARGALFAFMLSAAVALTSDRTVLAVAIIGVTLVHAAFGLARARSTKRDTRDMESIGLIAAMTVIVTAILYAFGDGHEAAITTLGLSLIGAIAFAAALVLRRSGWAYATLGISLVVPFVVGLGLIEPRVSVTALGTYFLGMTGVALVAAESWRRRGRAKLVILCTTGVALYAALALVLAGVSGHMAFAGVAFLVVAAYAVLLSYVIRVPWVELLAGILAIVGALYLATLGGLPERWQPLVAAGYALVLLLGLAGLHNARGERERRGYVLIAAYAALLPVVLVLTHGDQGSSLVAAGVFLVAALTTLTRMNLVQGTFDRIMFTSAFYTFIGLLALATTTQDQTLQAALFALIASLLFVGSHLDRFRGVILAANIALLFSLKAFATALNTGPEWTDLITAGVFVVLMFVLDALYVHGRAPVRQWYVLGSLWAVAGWAWLAYGFASQPYDIIGIAIGFIGGLSMAVHGSETSRTKLLESGIYVMTLAAQCAVGRLVPGLDLTLYAYWWAATVLLTGLMLRRNVTVYAAIALALISGVLGIYALAGKAGYALAFLLQHVAYVAAGFMLARRWVIWWGVIGVILGVLYFLRSYTYLWLGLLGLLLIGFVVWRLVRTDHADKTPRN